MGMESFGKKENRMGAKSRRAGPPPHVRRVYESGDPKAIAALKLHAAEAAQAARKEREDREKREKEFEENVEKVYGLRAKIREYERREATGENIIPLETYD